MAGGSVGEVGRLDFNNVHWAALSPSGAELVLSQSGKCHLITVDRGSTTTIAGWMEAVNEVIGVDA